MLINILTDMEMLPRLGTVVLGDFGSTGLLVATTILSVKFGELTSDANAILGNNISSALTFVSLGTTVITTFFIGYRIHSVSQLDGSRSNGLFNHIVVIIIESAAAYSLVLLLEAIDIVFPSFSVIGSPLSEADYYIQVILNFVANQVMAPTVLVARIALTDTNSTDASATLTYISSNFQFGSQQGSVSGHSLNTTGEVSASVRVDDAGPIPVTEVKRVFSADDTSGGNQV
ncbi:hypothetical protein CVT25_000295 [Psilocybe cyanescens]|uniref:Uncharacterized protein n=1 Tax=Psilocybe cyanescens TaxID=93625 RepID=A0A409XUF9_PSICY|nr:hypothetical protein CVT25_000295 [Psilocybe cyanescens]